MADRFISECPLPLRIVYLDDEADLLEMFVDIFTSESVIIEGYTDPNKAIQAVRDNPPDLILLDYRLPGITGDDVAAKMATPIPKVLITGEISVTLKNPFLRVISKPFDPVDMSNFFQSFSQQMVKAS